MALSTHKGGSADKAGLVHEALWGVRGFISVLTGEATSIRIETPGDDGAEFYLQRGDILEHWQAKRQVTGQDTWSLQRLKSEGVLAFFFRKFREGEKCVFASVSDAPELRMLSENASASPSLEEFRTHFLDKQRRKQFAELRQHVGAISDEQTFAFLQSVTVHGGREITLESFLGYALGAAFQGSWQNTIAVLRDLYGTQFARDANSLRYRTSLAELWHRQTARGYSRVRGATCRHNASVFNRTTCETDTRHANPTFDCG